MTEDEVPEWKRMLGSDPEELGDDDFLRQCSKRHKVAGEDGEGAQSDDDFREPLPPTNVQRIQQERETNPVPRPQPAVSIPVSGSNQGARKLIHDATLASYNKERKRIDPTGVAKEEKKRRKEDREKRGIVLLKDQKGEGVSNAEKCRKYRQRAKMMKQARVKQALRGSVLETANAMRSTSPPRRLPKESDTPLPPPGYQGPCIRDNQVLTANHCTIHTWVTVNDREFVSTKQKELEAAVKSWMNDRNNKAFRQTLQGGDTTTRFERGHPCANAKIPDVTMCESIKEVREVLAGLQGPGSYVARIETAFERSVDLSSVWSGRVHDEAKSEEVIAGAKALQPVPNDGPLYNFLSFDHMGHWRARCELTSSFAAPRLDQLATDMRLPPSHEAKPNYAHCTLKDVSQVLRNPRLVEAMTNPVNGPKVGGVLLGYDALCREAVRQIPHDSTEWDRTSLAYDNQSWRRSQVWAPFFAALVARLCCMPLPSLEDLGVAGNWWIGREATNEGPHMRAVRHHLAHLTVARTVLDHIIQPKTGLWMKSRDTLLATELGCDMVPRLIEETMRNYLHMRYNCLSQVHTLTAAWMAYVFGRGAQNLDYIPLSFTFRALGTDSNKISELIEYKRNRRDFGWGEDKMAAMEFADNTLAMGVLMNQRHVELEATGGLTSGKKSALAQSTFHNMDLSDGQLAKRLDAGIFLETVWSSVRGDDKPYCVNGGITVETVAIATMYRSYDLYARKQEVCKVTAMPAGVVSRNPSDMLLNAIHHVNQVVWAPVTYYASDLVKSYVDSCINGGFIQAQSNARARYMTWRLLDKDPRMSIRYAGQYSEASEAIVKTFNERYYVVERTSPALQQASWVSGVGTIDFATALRDVRGVSEAAFIGEEGTSDQSSEAVARTENQIVRRLREAVLILIGGSMRGDCYAVSREQVLAKERECGYSTARQ
jgi:hypothetical protein